MTAQLIKHTSYPYHQPRPKPNRPHLKPIKRKHPHCVCSHAYGAMMHALPRKASQLHGMSEDAIFAYAQPWVNRVPPASEREFDTWAIQSVHPNPTGLGDLGDLAELAGLKKKLKKVAKKLAAPVKAVVKAHVKIIKKAEKSKIIKKLARPLAYAIGAATGTAALVAQADKVRTAARKLKAKVKEVMPNEPVAAAQPQVETASPEPVYSEPAQQTAPLDEPAYNEPIYQPAPLQNSFVSPQPQQAAPVYQAPVAPAPRPAPRQAAAPVYEESAEPVYQAAQQSFAPAKIDPFANFNPVQRMQSEESEEQPKIVGLSATGIMENIKANPIPWAVGGLGLGFILYRAMNNHGQRPARAY